MKIKFILFLLLIVAFSANGQTKLDFRTVEIKSLHFYESQKWDSLITFGKQAIKQNIDYYYLNYRLGVAFFRKNNFHKSAYYFQQAIEQNKAVLDDPFLVELLHLALVYSSRNDLAMDVPLPEKSTIEDPLIRNRLYLFGGGGKLLGYNKKDAQVNPSAIYSEYRYQDAVGYWGFRFNHQFSSSFKLGASYSNLNFTMKTIIIDTKHDFDKSYKVNQINIALLPEFTLGTKWQLKPVFAYTSNKGFPFSLIDTKNSENTYDYWNYKEQNFMLGLNAFRYIRNIKLGFNIGLSNYSLRKQVQAGLNLTYYPWGNLNFYTFTELAIKVDNRNKDLVFQQQLGFKMISKVWIELGGYFGSLKNYSNYNLAYTYSIADDMNMLLSAKLIYVLTKNINFFVEGQYLEKYTKRIEYENVNEYKEINIDYNQWNIEGGLLWKL